MEGKEWIWDNGILKEKTINEYCQLIRKSNRVNLEERCLDAFKDFLSKI